MYINIAQCVTLPQMHNNTSTTHPHFKKKIRQKKERKKGRKFTTITEIKLNQHYSNPNLTVCLRLLAGITLLSISRCLG